MKKLETVNILTIVLLGIGFFNMIKIDNDSRLPGNINTDYFMNSLPYIYLIIACILVLVLLTLLRIRYFKVNE